MVTIFIIEDNEKIPIEESCNLKISEQFISFINKLELHSLQHSLQL